MIIKLNNNRELKAISIIGKRRFCKGADRDTLTFGFDVSEYGADELLELFSDADNTKIITITDESIDLSRYRPEENVTNTYVHMGYTLFAGLRIQDEISEEETNLAPESTNRVISVTMGQKTYTEEQADIQTENVNALTEVVADMIGGAYNE